MMLRLEYERRHRGLSQAELARQTGLHPSTISKIESGRLNPYESQIRKLATALDMSEEEMLEEVRVSDAGGGLE